MRTITSRALLDPRDLLFEIDFADGHKGGGGIGRQAGELGVVVRDEDVAEVGVGGLERGDAREAELVDQTALKRAAEAFAAAAALRRVAGDVVEPEALRKL